MTNVEKVLEKYGEDIVIAIQNRLKNANKYATGNLYNSINYKYSTYAGGYRIQVTGLKYLINVDRGRRIGARRPPIMAIYNWIVNKRIKFNKPKVKQVNNSQQTVTTKKVDPRMSMAYAVATNISKRGIKPLPILSKGVAVTQSSRFKQDIALAAWKDSREKLVQSGIFKVTSISK